FVSSRVDAPDGERPVFWVDRPPQTDGIADPPPEPIGELSSDDRALAVVEVGFLFGRIEYIVRVEVEIVVFHGEVREEMLLVNENPAEPVDGADLPDPGCLPDLL